MDITPILVLLVLAGFGLIFLFSRKDSNRPPSPFDQGADESPGTPPRHEEFPPPSKDTQASSSERGSLLDQLSMINARSFPALSRNQIPEKLYGFFGRKELIHEIMGRNWVGAGPICLYGKKGVGKTSLAVELAHQLAPKYPDAQFYIDFKGDSDHALSVVKAMGHVVRAFYPSESLPADTSEMVNEYRQVLRGKRVLIVLENVIKPNQIKRLLPPKSGLLMFTSLEKITLPGTFAKPVKEFFPDESEAFIGSLAKGSRRWAGEIGELCGHSPLALSLAVGFINGNSDFPVETFVKELREERRLMKPEGEEKKDPKNAIIDRDIQAVFNISYRNLRKETATVFRKLALFPGSFDEKAEASICGDRDSMELKRLLQLKLVEYDKLNQRYFFHELIHQLMQSELRPSEKILTNRSIAVYYLNTLNSANELYSEDNEDLESALNLFDMDWVNIQAGQSWAAGKCADDLEIAKLCGDYSKAAEILMPMRLPPKECIEWNEAALTAARQSQNTELEKNNLLNLGEKLHELGKHNRAVEYLEEAQELARQLGHLADEKRALNMLGLSSIEIKNGPRAVESFERVLEIVRIEGNKNHEMETLNNLGQALFMTEDLKRAEETFQEALALTQKHANKPLQSKVLEGLGSVCLSMKKYQSAIPNFNQGLTIAHQCDDRPREKSILEKMADAYLLLGKPKRSIECLESAMAITKKTGDEVGQGMIFKRMGDLYRHIKDYSKSIESYEKGWPKIRKSSFFNLEFALLRSLGDSYMELQRYEKAIICFKHGTVLGRRISDPFKESQSLWFMSQVYQKSGDIPQAMRVAEEASKTVVKSMHEDARKLREEIKEWMIKRVESEIKDSGM